MSSFEICWRTGRRVAGPVDVETKFNPWHDPVDGRFIFAGLGRRFPDRADPRAGRRDKSFEGAAVAHGGGSAKLFGIQPASRSSSRNIGRFLISFLTKLVS